MPIAYLRLDVSLVCGLQIPLHGSLVVQRNASALIVHLANVELGTHGSLVGGLHKALPRFLVVLNILLSTKVHETHFKVEDHLIFKVRSSKEMGSENRLIFMTIRKNKGF